MVGRLTEEQGLEIHRINCSEIKEDENRIAVTPSGVVEFKQHGHEVFVQAGAGTGSSITDEMLKEAGATIVPEAEGIWEKSNLIMKVKEPLNEEFSYMRPGQVIFTYLHLAPDPEQTEDLVKSGATCIAYETVTSPHGGLPLLAPMSKVAGRMAIQAGAHCLEQPHGGLGMLLGGVPGVPPAKVVILGSGVVGTHATHMAVGMGADVWVLDRDPDALENHWRQFGRSTNTIFSTQDAIEQHVTQADLVIGGVLIPGSSAPKLVSRDLVKAMKRGSVIIDVAIDQGGCVETSRPTTHDDPTFVIDGVIHYCVANMPGGVPRTSTYALNNVTLPHVLTLANKGWRQALRHDAHLRDGLNVHAGQITCQEVADSLGYPFVAAEDLL